MIRPAPRERIHRLYWYFAAERQRVFQQRVQGAPRPWTDDGILRAYKFCNVYRASDRVSQYLIRSVAYHPDDDSPEDRLFQILAFRTFSRIATWESLRTHLGRAPRINDLKDGTLVRALNRTKSENGGLYTGAFILCATDAYARGKKHLNHVALFHHMFVKNRLGARLLAAKSLKSVYDMLHAYPLMGDFMSYQTAIDLNYSEYLGFSENDFTQAGPGAVRGLKKVFHSLGDFTPRDAIMWMVDSQETEFVRNELTFDGLWGRPLHAIDCQGLFCEVDKYCREAVPELSSARSRIKAKFTPSDAPIRLFFPPRWKLNPLLPREPVFGRVKAQGMPARGLSQAPS